MLTQVEISNSQGDVLTLSLEDVVDGFILEEIEGLDPVKATLISTSNAEQDGEQYQASRREKRNLLFKIGLEPDWSVDTVRDLRMELYDYFMTKSQVNMRFTDSGGLIVDITGRVESCDTPLFAKEPRVDVSVVCFQPDLVKFDEVVLEGDTTDTTDETFFYYDGNVDTGFIFTLLVDRTLDAFTIYLRGPDGILRSMDVAVDMLAGDILVINTYEGEKGATLTRSSVATSVLYGISSQSTWHQISPHNNNIRIYAVGDPVPWEISYHDRYGGL